jgi:mono/diheme cytochrome c family protein
LPASMRGQLFYGEPVARIVRQINPMKTEGLTTLHNVYQDQKSEFIRSTDPLFRPIDMATAPDGTMYIVDMYHGIIQEGQWTPKGSYLRTKIEQYQLDKVVGLGRIWRVSHEGFKRDTKQPRMYDDKSATLVTYLNHPNGWWQDMAQQVLVQRNDKSVVPALNALALKGTNVNGRIHAIWTLEGLGALKVATVSKLATDANPRIRIQALKASETLYKAGEKSLAALYNKALKDSDNEVVMQAIFTQKFLKVPEYEKGIKETLVSNKSAGVKLIGEQIIAPPKPRTNGPFNGPELSKEQKGILERGELVFAELCSQCHGNDGMGKSMGNGKLLAPALAGSFRIQQHPEYAVRVLLHGLEGSIEGKNYAGGLMQPMKEQSDQWIADVVSYIRNGLSNDASFVSPAQVAAIRANTSKQAGMYKFEALMKQVPVEFVPDQSWKFYATHTASTRVGGNASPKSAFNYEGWSTGKTQEKDMVFQVEFPSEYTFSEFHFTSSSSFKRGQRPKPGETPEYTHTYPRNITVEASMDGLDWKVVQANVKGTQGDNMITLPATRAKFMRLKLAEAVNAAADEVTPWSMRSMKIFGLR